MLDISIDKVSGFTLGGSWKPLPGLRPTPRCLLHVSHAERGTLQETMSLLSPPLPLLPSPRKRRVCLWKSVAKNRFAERYMSICTYFAVEQEAKGDREGLSHPHQEPPVSPATPARPARRHSGLLAWAIPDHLIPCSRRPPPSLYSRLRGGGGERENM